MQGHLLEAYCGKSETGKLTRPPRNFGEAAHGNFRDLTAGLGADCVKI